MQTEDGPIPPSRQPPSREPPSGLVYPRIGSMDVDGLWLLAEWHEVRRKPFSSR
jgi:hypothetical protein